MTNEDKKMIPLSVIDALITSVEDFGENYRYHEVIELLENLKKEAIPLPSELEGGLHCPVCHFDYIKQKRTKTSGHWDSKCQCMCHQDHQGLEQKINDRIASLEIDNNYCYECGLDYQNEIRDELRKLLE